LLANFIIPNSEKQLKAKTWMQSFFKLVGDNAPNKAEEIHLDSCFTRNSIYNEYKSTMTVWYGDTEFLSISAFGTTWKSCFPHVKVRKFKAVSGKCMTCSHLSELRLNTRDNARRANVTLLHSYHRHMYMGEREGYYKRQALALRDPQRYMSLIIDGMQQGHSEIPYQANQAQFPNKIKQHLQGVIEHGDNFTMYRSFANVQSASNLNIHSFLLQLERRTLDKRYGGKLPKTIFLQIDGGSENATDSLLAICALIVAHRLCGVEEIILSRLPVGHTHEV